jgi:hypothetical protein
VWREYSANSIPTSPFSPGASEGPAYSNASPRISQHVLDAARQPPDCITPKPRLPSLSSGSVSVPPVASHRRSARKPVRVERAPMSSSPTPPSLCVTSAIKPQVSSVKSPHQNRAAKRLGVRHSAVKVVQRGTSSRRTEPLTDPPQQAPSSVKASDGIWEVQLGPLPGRSQTGKPLTGGRCEPVWRRATADWMDPRVRTDAQVLVKTPTPLKPLGADEAGCEDSMSTPMKDGDEEKSLQR